VKARGEANGNCRLSDADVELIRDLHRHGCGYKRIRAKFDDRARPPGLTKIRKIVNEEIRRPLSPEQLVRFVEGRWQREAQRAVDAEIGRLVSGWGAHDR
jgi:hypothetical protein